MAKSKKAWQLPQLIVLARAPFATPPGQLARVGHDRQGRPSPAGREPHRKCTRRTPPRRRAAFPLAGAPSLSPHSGNDVIPGSDTLTLRRSAVIPGNRRAEQTHNRPSLVTLKRGQAGAAGKQPVTAGRIERGTLRACDFQPATDRDPPTPSSAPRRGSSALRGCRGPSRVAVVAEVQEGVQRNLPLVYSQAKAAPA
jgi:hypothetical protein